MNTDTHFYHDKPVFGLDIGYSNLKVLQVEVVNKKHRLSGYGVANFAPEAIKEGVIVDPEALAKVTKDLFSKHLVGDITTRRVAMAIPASRTFNRTMTLPKMKKTDIANAVNLEAEQYIPMPLSDLYLDYSIISNNDKGIEVLVVAVPRKIVDSYLQLAQLLGL